MKKFGMAIAMLLTALSLSACGESNADKANENLGKEAEKFNIQRRIIAYNSITDKVLLEVEGRCSIERNGALPNNLEIICKDGPDSYKKHHVGLADNITWVNTQLQGIDVSEYRTKFIFRPESIVPDFDLVTGDGG